MRWTGIVNPGGRAGAEPASSCRRSKRAHRRQGQISPTAKDPVRLAAKPRSRVTTSSRAAATGCRRRRGRRVAADTGPPARGRADRRRQRLRSGLGFTTPSIPSAFGTLEHGHDRVIDLGRVNDRWYTCVTASGFDAEANRWANTVHRLSGTALYVAAVLRTMVVYKPHPFRLTVDGEAHELRAWLVAVGNGPAYGGGMNIAPSARLDDGLLDVTVVGDDVTSARCS